MGRTLRDPAEAGTQVVQATGAPESDLTAASVKAIDAEGPIQLVEAAKQLGVQQYIMVTSLGTGKFGLPAGMFSLISISNFFCNPQCPSQSSCDVQRPLLVIVTCTKTGSGPTYLAQSPPL